MLDLIQITNDPQLALRCEALGGMRPCVDLERLGKAERQAGRDTLISDHTAADVRRLRPLLQRTRLMVRVNPLNPGTPDEVDAVLAAGADLLMLPMFTGTRDLQAFCSMVGGRAPVVALLETASALDSLDSWIRTPGLQEVFVGLNDLHLSLGQRFMFEPLADGALDRVARACHAIGVRFGFGGIARMTEGLLPGRDVLAEHLRLGSGAVILSRTFHRADDGFEREVAALRSTELALQGRSAVDVERDRQRTGELIRSIASTPDARR